VTEQDVTTKATTGSEAVLMTSSTSPVIVCLLPKLRQR
jgi:hypothetical protein